VRHSENFEDKGMQKNYVERRARFACVSFKKTYAIYPYALKFTVAW